MFPPSILSLTTATSAASAHCWQVLLPTSDVKSYSPEAGASKSGSKVSYAALGKQGPWAVQELKVHFHHDKPFKRVRGCCLLMMLP
jgi:hypothetical protein